MDDEVTMFFTFWGLNILRRPEKVPAKKSFLQSMFGSMMPQGAGRLGLSRMNFSGMGAGMMKSRNVISLPELMASAREQGVKLLACTMSMDVMGFSEDELIDGLEFAGVASYLGEADEANVNLFI
jgi:peroxiredoxin family protein